MRAIIFDTETTGLLLPEIAPLEQQPRIIEVGAVVLDADGSRLMEFSRIINPKQEITAEITKITGITNEDVASAPTFDVVLPELVSLFDGCDMMIAHNAEFDRTMLANELRRAGQETFPWPADIVCTVVEYEALLGKRYRLSALYELILGRPLEQTHRALDDAAALAELIVADGFLGRIA